MTPNIGNTDRTIRLIAGVALLSLFFLGDGTLKWLGLIGIVPIATALMRFCPLYPMCGINTCKNDQAE